MWRALLDAHATITQKLAAELEAERELPLSWYEVLLQLNEAGGRLRMAELSSRMIIHKSSLTRLVDRMEDAGLVAREPCVTDGRGHYAVLTRDGRDTFRRAAPVHLRGIQREFGRHLTETDVTALQRVLAKLPRAPHRDEPD